MMDVFGNLEKYLTEERFNTVKGMVMAKKQKHSILLYKIRRERCRPFRAAYESRKEQKLKST